MLRDLALLYNGLFTVYGSFSERVDINAIVNFMIFGLAVIIGATVIILKRLNMQEKENERRNELERMYSMDIVERLYENKERNE